MVLPTPDANAPTLLLVHGAWPGSWCGDRVRSLLAADGRATRVADLPSAGREAAGVREDACEVLRGLERGEGPVVVVAHSFARSSRRRPGSPTSSVRPPTDWRPGR
ncbi:alpha/beta fold hydrolase [Actinacidiphila glaucinigra]|uniref:alpha/beta fold hydrolase n=1 Tax=Actinacidiphila glaucinigra TaxID=235986 RepID=UPI003409F8D3